MKIVLTGGTGFIGRAMVRAWGARHQLMVLTREVERARQQLPESVTCVHWDGKTLGEWLSVLEGADVVVNLAGENIAQRWTPAVKERLRQSRIQPTRLLVEAVAQLRQPPALWLQASAIGIYDQNPALEVDENSPPGKGFLAELGVEWESAARPAESQGVRLCWMRFGIVLGAGGGALEKMLPPFRLGVGGPIGSGRQWLSWIHIEDVVGAAHFLMEQPHLAGVFNFTAPNPVTMDEFARTLGKILHRPAGLRVPAFALKILLGEMAESLLQGSRVLPRRLLKAGYAFRYPELESALRAVLTP
ncbi:Epimerase family protein [bacterium HR15]|nr:Epimerase family protein [bacterium HR15]